MRPPPLVFIGCWWRRSALFAQRFACAAYAARAPKADKPPTVYTAEDIRIQQYGETAIVAFRLVATGVKDGKPEIRNLFNTGTFLKRNGEWRAVSWQATVMPSAEAKK